MKEIIIYTFCCDNFWKSIIMVLEKPGKLGEFFVILVATLYNDKRLDFRSPVLFFLSLQIPVAFLKPVYARACKLWTSIHSVEIVIEWNIDWFWF